VPSTPPGFTLPNGADRSPDAAWVRQETLDDLNPDQTSSPLAPDFVVELMSANDSPEKQQNKMRSMTMVFAWAG